MYYGIWMKHTKKQEKYIWLECDADCTQSYCQNNGNHYLWVLLKLSGLSVLQGYYIFKRLLILNIMHEFNKFWVILWGSSLFTHLFIFLFFMPHQIREEEYLLWYVTFWLQAKLCLLGKCKYSASCFYGIFVQWKLALKVGWPYIL